MATGTSIPSPVLESTRVSPGLYLDDQQFLANSPTWRSGDLYDSGGSVRRNGFACGGGVFGLRLAHWIHCDVQSSVSRRRKSRNQCDTDHRGTPDWGARTESATRRATAARGAKYLAAALGRQDQALKGVAAPAHRAGNPCWWALPEVASLTGCGGGSGGGGGSGSQPQTYNITVTATSKRRYPIRLRSPSRFSDGFNSRRCTGNLSALRVSALLTFSANWFKLRVPGDIQTKSSSHSAGLIPRRRDAARQVRLNSLHRGGLREGNEDEVIDVRPARSIPNVVDRIRILQRVHRVDLDRDCGLRLLCLESLQRKPTCLLSRLSSLPLEMATRWV